MFSPPVQWPPPHDMLKMHEASFQVSNTWFRLKMHAPASSSCSYRTCWYPASRARYMPVLLFLDLLQEKKMSITGENNLQLLEHMLVIRNLNRLRIILDEPDHCSSLLPSIQWFLQGTSTDPLTVALHWAFLEMDHMNVMEVNCVHPTLPVSRTSFLCCSAKSPLLWMGTWFVSWRWRRAPLLSPALPNLWTLVGHLMMKYALAQLPSPSGN